MLGAPIDSSLLLAVLKAADSIKNSSDESSILVRTVPIIGNILPAKLPSFVYSFRKSSISDGFTIDFSRISQLLRRESIHATEYEITLADEVGAAPSPADEKKIRNNLQRLAEKNERPASASVTHIIIPFDVDISTSLLSISWFIPYATRCISVEFRGENSENNQNNELDQNNKDDENDSKNSKIIESNLEALLIGLSGSSVLLTNCEALLMSHIVNISRRRCSEITQSHIRKLPNLKIISMTYGDDQSDSSSGIDSDLRAAAKIWTNIAHEHGNLRLLRCTKGQEFWIPVYLLTATAPRGWLDYLSVEWRALALDNLSVTSSTTSEVEGKQKGLFTEFETNLTAGLILLNTWFEEVYMNIR